MNLVKKVFLFSHFMFTLVIIMMAAVLTVRFVDVHYTNTDAKIYIEYEDGVDQRAEAFTDSLKRFSKEYKINFIIKRYLSEDLVILYASNIESDERFNGFDQETLEGNSFVSNLETNNPRQVGRLKAYLSETELRIYDIDSIAGSGLEHEIYIYGYQEDLMPELTEALSDFGEIRLIKSEITLFSLLDRVSMKSALIIAPIIVLCFILMYAIVCIIYARGQIRLIEICRLSGKTTGQTLTHMAQALLRSGIVQTSLLALLISVVILIFMRYEIVLYYFHAVMIAFIFVFAFSTILQAIISAALIQRVNRTLTFGKKDYIKLNMLVLTATKMIAIVVLLTSLSNVMSNYKNYHEQLNSMRYWISNKNIHRVIVSSEALKYRGDLALEKYFNDRIASLYETLVLNHKAFIIKSTNFLRFENNDEFNYLYQQVPLKKNEILSNQGMSIVVDEAYLKRNKIFTIENQSVLDVLVSDQNVLNVIVPNQYLADENIIRKNYLEYFYFQKVTVNNIYNEAISQPLNEQNKSELSINIIYAKEDQKYFTYSSHTGDPYGNITDPIVVVFNPSVDHSNIMSLLTSSVYFESDHEDAAYFDIYPAIRESGVSEVKSTQSAYSEVAKNVRDIKLSLIANFLLCVLSVIIFISSMIQYTLLYYSLNKKKLTIKYLLGKGNFHLQMNAHIFLSNILVFGFTCVFMRRSIFLIILLVLTISEIYAVNLLCRKNTEKNAGSIVKG